MQDFRELKVWVKAHALALAVYKATSVFLQEELYGVTSQMRRSASSIPANIAEGCGTNTRSEFARFLQIALRSASELEYHLLLSRDLSMLKDLEFRSLSADVIEVKRMLTALTATLRSYRASRHP